MLLRRVTGHVRAQNWTAVVIDFAIVVIGVFIGIQVANWNDGRTSKRNYLQALARAKVEIAGNITFIGAETKAIENSLLVARAGFDALLSCSEGADSVRKVNEALIEIRGTRGVQTRTTAVTELATNPAHLAEQSDSLRTRLAGLRFYQELALTTSERYEPTIYDLWPAESPTLAIQPAVVFKTQWLGIEYEVPRYAVALGVSVQEACIDKGLLNATLRFQKPTTFRRTSIVGRHGHRAFAVAGQLSA